MIDAPPLAADPVAAARRAALAFAEAARHGPLELRDVAFAGRRLRLRLTARVAAALHLAAFAPAAALAPEPAPDANPDLQPDLHIDLWDRADAPLDPPEPGRAKPLVVGRNRASAGASHVTWEPPLVWGFDTAARRGHWYCDDPAALATLSRGQPLLRMLHEWCQALGLRVLHGAAIGRAGRGLLLTAPGGSGKSTLALAARLAGWDYLGDDYVALAPAADAAARPRVHGTYAVAKLAPAHLAARFPALAASALAARDGDKTLLAQPLTPLADGLAVAAVVVPSIAGLPTGPGPTRAERISPGRALTALAPSTLFQLPGAGATDLAPLAAFIRAVPAWGLAVGPDLGDAVAVLERILTEAP